MATIKVANEEGEIAEFEYKIESLDKDENIINSKDNSVRIDKSGLITEEIIVKSIIGKQTINFPLEFKTRINGVFIARCNEELKPYIYITNFNLKSFDIIIKPHPYTFDLNIYISAIGY